MSVRTEIIVSISIVTQNKKNQKTSVKKTCQQKNMFTK